MESAGILYNNGMETTLAASPPTAKRDASVDPAVLQRLRQRQAAWATLTVRVRLHSIRRLRNLLPEMHEEFCESTRADLYKQATETLAGELLPVAAACRYLERHAAGLLRQRKPSWFDRPVWLFGERDAVIRKPRGVVGIIGTWNYPVFLNATQMVQALVAGNSVIWKPSEVAPLTAEVTTRWLRRAEVPDDLVHVLPAEREWGIRLAESDVDYIVFTGHDTTGRKLAARLGERLIPSTLELSGHDAALVLEDANLDLVARALAFAVTLNSGQTCVAPRRVFVSRSVYPVLQEKLKSLIEKAVARPLAQRQQAGHANRFIADAIGDGARLLSPAHIPAEGGVTYPPVVLADVDSDMAITNEALFAPVLLLCPFEKLDEAVADIQRSDYGLGLSVFTADIERARRLAAELPAGMVTVNDLVAPVAHPATPLGGVGRSGWGVTQGAEGLLEMTVPQVISSRRGEWRPHFDPPDTTVFTNAGVLAAMLCWKNARTFGQRLAGLWRLLRAIKRARRQY